MKNFYRTLIILLFVLVQLSCRKSDTISDQKYQISSDTFHIDIPVDAIDYYTKIDLDKDKSLLIGYNRFTHSIQFFDIRKNKYSKSVQLQRDGPERINTVGDLFIAGNYIILHAIPEWITIDLDGNIIHRLSLKDIESPQGHRYLIDGGIKISQLRKIEVSEGGEYVYLGLMPANSDPGSPDRYSHPLFCKVMLQSDGVLIIDEMKYPDIFRQGTDFGVLNRPSVIEVRGKLVYSFPNHSTIYEYDTLNKAIDSHDFFPDRISPVIDVVQNRGYRETIRSSISADRYYPVKYDEYRDRYYRLIRVKDTIQDVNNFYLLVLDADFNLIKEVFLSKDEVYAPNYVITEKGILFQLTTSGSDLLDFSYIIVKLEKA